jgi:glycosyltransferase involved in cell wall biosynthesis
MPKSERPIRICHVTSAHPAEDIRIFVKEAISAAKAGFDVHLVTAGTQDYQKNGVYIHGISGKTGGRFTRMWKTVNCVYEKAISLDADIYQLHDPELLRIALRLKKNGKIVLFDAHEDVPAQIMAKHWIPKPLRRLVAFLFKLAEKYILSRITGVIAATPFIRNRLEKLNPRCVDINNYPLLNEFPEPGTEEKKIHELVYIGGISETRGIFPLLDMIHAFGTRISLGLAGPFSPPGLEEKVRKHPAFPLVTYYGNLDRQGVSDLLKKSLIGMVTLLPTPNHLESQPIKMYEYMAAGIPVIASDFPYWKEIISRCGCGITVNPADPESIKKAVIALLENETWAASMGQKGREAIEKEFNWEVEEKRLIAFYTQIIDGRRN